MNASATGALPMNDPFDTRLPSMKGLKQGVQNSFQQLTNNAQNAFKNLDNTQFGQKQAEGINFGQQAS